MLRILRRLGRVTILLGFCLWEATWAPMKKILKKIYTCSRWNFSIFFITWRLRGGGEGRGGGERYFQALSSNLQPLCRVLIFRPLFYLQITNSLFLHFELWYKQFTICCYTLGFFFCFSVVAFPLLVRILGECSMIHSQPAWLFYLKWRLACAH